MEKQMRSNKITTNDFEDIKVNIKIKLSALWASVTLCYLYGDYFELYVPQKTQGLITGENLLNSPMKLFAASALLAIPALMVFLSVILNARINRWVNVVLGIIYTAIMLLIAFTSLIPWRTFYVFLAIIESAITSLIVYYAWNWTRNKTIS
ncbi:MAG: DUF6326 family protein [Bacteroidota bacterium]